MTGEELNIQKQIDAYRKEGVEIIVDHFKMDCPKTDEDYFEETTISVAFSDKWDAMSIAQEIRDELAEPCDSGAGFGYRDLQLCRLLPNLK